MHDLWSLKNIQVSAQVPNLYHEQGSQKEETKVTEIGWEVEREKEEAGV